MLKIVTVTMNPTIDKSAEIEQMEKDAKMRCTAVRYDPGGGGINVSRAINRLGGSSLAVYLAGGVEGEKLRGLLESESVRHRPVRVDDPIRENFTVFESATDSQYRFGMPGPTVRQAEWQQALSAVSEAISGGGLLVGSGSLPPGVPNDFYARLAEIASGEDAKCIIDTSGEALRESLVAKPYLIKPNMRELKDIVGRSDLEDPEIRDAARELIEDGKAEHVVVSLGAGGAILVSEESVDKFQSPTVPIRSRIGAGDSMIGGIVHALSKGSSMREALQWGIAAGAAAVITPGTELCRREDVDRLYNEVVDRNG